MDKHRAGPNTLCETRIVVVNDDGIDAPGLQILRDAALRYSDDVWVVAPVANQSAKSRSMSFRREVSVENLGSKRIGVHGTPVDCVLLALNGLLPGKRPELVLSGVNSGGNLADDVGFSGTVAACLESAQEGVPGIAFSQARPGPKLVVPKPVDWTCASALTPELLPDLVTSLTTSASVLNVNFPAVSALHEVKGLVVTHCGWREAPTVVGECEPRDGRRTFMVAPLRDNIPNEEACDLGLNETGYITVTPLALDATDHARMSGLRKELAGLCHRDYAETWTLP